MVLRNIFFTIFLLMITTVSGEVMTIRFDTGPVYFKNNTPTIQGFDKLQIPGTPILPAKSVVLALPPGSEVVSVDVHSNPPVMLEHPGLRTAPPHLPLSRNENVEDHVLEQWQRNKAYLRSCNELFPKNPVYYSKMSHFRNIPFIRIIYFPLLVTKHTLFHYPATHIAIHYIRQESDNKIADWVNEDAARFFANWNTVKGYYDIFTQEDSFSYVIITKDSLFTAFDSLVMWKNSIGFRTRLMSFDSIIATYPGVDGADRMRNFLIDKHDSSQMIGIVTVMVFTVSMERIASVLYQRSSWGDFPIMM